MVPAVPRPLIALLGLTAALGLAGCGKTATSSSTTGGPARKLAPVAAQGAVSVSTRNTTRLGGADTSEDAAAIARAVYSGLTPEARPHAVVLVDERNWSAALAASVLASAPLNAPILYSEGSTLPAVSRESLEAMQPIGDPALGGAQVITVGSTAPLPAGLRARSVAVGEPAYTAASVERLLRTADGGAASHAVIVLAASAARALQMPAAGLAAESGAPILFVTRSRVPAATAEVLAALGRPSIYVISPASVGSRTIAELRRFGAVTSIAPAAAEGPGPAANAVAVARFTNGTFGWGVKEPGHGLAFLNAGRPLDAPAAALLSATGDYAPLLLLEAADQIPPPLASYLSDIQPAYTSAPQFQPVRGVYNHGWLIGDETAISSVTQTEIDSLLEISPRKPSSEEASVTAAE